MSAPPPARRECCWHGVPDAAPPAGGGIPVVLPFDGGPAPGRLLFVAHPDHLFVPERCCKCKARRNRTWKHVPMKGHDGVLELVETTEQAPECRTF